MKNKCKPCCILRLLGLTLNNKWKGVSESQTSTYYNLPGFKTDSVKYPYLKK